MNVTVSVDCVDACLTNVPEITELGRLLAAAVPPNHRRQTLSHHTTFSCQPGRRGDDLSSCDNPVLSLASCGLDEKKCIRIHGGDWFVLLDLPNAYCKNDRIRIQVGGRGKAKKGALADAVFKTLHFFFDVGS